MFSYVVRRHDAQVELYIDRGKGSEAENKAVFDQLAANREAIEAAFGGEQRWERLDGKQAWRISSRISMGGLQDEDRWPEIHSAMVEAMVRLEAALRPQIAMLPL